MELNNTNKRYQVFSIKEIVEKNERKSVWVKAGSAWVNRDGSMNVYLDVLPLDGKLHVRQAVDERKVNLNTTPAATNGSSTEPAVAIEAQGGL